jgi:hypothetical protein
MRLAELEATFIRRCPVEGGGQGWQEGVPFSEAEGVQFLCPVCIVKNAGPIGTHSVVCWRPTVGQDWKPVPGRWDFQGTGLEDLTLVAGSSSIRLTCECKQQPCSCCKAHFFIRNGAIIY